MKSLVRLPQSIDDNLNWQAVSVVLIDELGLYLIKRSETMPTHAGQLACIGGNRKIDEHNPLDVALREFSEETNMHPGELNFLGYLPPVFTARNQSLIPAVMNLEVKVNDFFKTVKSNGEWTDLIFVEWNHLFSINSWEWAQRISLNNEFFPVYFRPIFPLEYRSLNQDQSSVHLLWGATASIVLNLMNYVGEKKWK
jgi:8-oxo-dGTP pyrophosphatase MutT (NUDIX family)